MKLTAEITMNCVHPIEHLQKTVEMEIVTDEFGFPVRSPVVKTHTFYCAKCGTKAKCEIVKEKKRMTIEEAKIKKRELEKEFEVKLIDFQTETGLTVQSIYTMNHNTDFSGTPIHTAVEIRIDLP